MRPIYLLDTNIISEFYKPFPNKNVYKKINEYENVSAISSITWDELIYGVNLMSSGKKRDFVFDKLVNEIQANFKAIQKVSNLMLENCL